MKTHYFFLMLCAALLPFYACSDDAAIAPASSIPDDAVQNPQNAVAYEYMGFSRGGTMIVRGYLYLSQRDSIHVEGHWGLRPLADTMRIGPQHGRGTLVGELRSTTLYVNLNPGYADNNVLLTGELRRASYSGRWEWVGFAGVLTSGTFRASRLRVYGGETTQ